MNYLNKSIVFLSVSNKDRNFARSIKAYLEKNGVEVFYYEENFETGNFQEKIREAITRANIFVPVYSPDYFESKWCTDEFDAWRIKQNKQYKKENQSENQRVCYPIIPIIYRTCEVYEGYLIDKNFTISEENIKEGSNELIKCILNYKSDQIFGISMYNYVWSKNRKDSKPYHINTFGVDDEELFNTREIFIDSLNSIWVKIEKHESNFITIVGESGSGKTSLVLAGLVPRLAKKQNWKFVYVEFNEDPYQDLAAGLISIIKEIRNPTKTHLEDVNKLSTKLKESEEELNKQLQIIKENNPDTRILFIADQLDSLYTKCRSQEIRKRFLTLLKNSLQKADCYPIVFVATFDLSNFQKVENDRENTDFIKKDIEKLPDIQDEVLIRLIIEPADKLGVNFEKRVAEEIIRELGERKNNLYLLGVVLVNIWNIKEKHRLEKITKREYIDSGGVVKALDTLASENFRSLEDYDKKAKARKLFLRMVHHQDRESQKILTRKITVNSDEYTNLIRELSEIIKTTDSANNKTPSGKIEIEFIHASLADNWTLLKDWINLENNFDKVRILENNAKEWDENNKNRWSILNNWKNLLPGIKWFESIKLYKNHEYLFNDPKLIKKFIDRSIAKFLVLVIGGFYLIGLGYLEYESGKEKSKLSSIGEKRLFATIDSNKNNGIRSFDTRNYDKAIKNFEKARQINRNDPENLIYLNNSKVLNWERNIPNLRSVQIAASVPIGGNKEIALEMLRGVAHAQDDLIKDFEKECIVEKKYKNNCKHGIKGRPLLVKIINDSNDAEAAIKIAKHLVKDQNILAVVGHNASEVSSAAAIEYQKGGLVMITPTSFAPDFAALDDKFPERNNENYFFATAHSYEMLINRLIEEMVKQLPGKIKPGVLLCYDGDAFDQRAFVESFTDSNLVDIINSNKTEENYFFFYLDKIIEWFTGKKGENTDCNFGRANLDLDDILQKALKNEAFNTIFLAPHVNRIGDSIAVLRYIRKDPNFDKKEIKIFTSPTLYTNQTLTLGEENVVGLTMAVSWFPQQSPEKDSYENKARDLWIGTKGLKNSSTNLLEIGITWRTVMAYDATNIIIERFVNAREISRKSLQESLSKEFSFDGITGSIKFFGKCPKNNETIDGVRCATGKRMKMNEERLNIIEIVESAPPKGFKLYKFK